ncbi:MAG: hypothetical protein ACFFDF_16105, partial [Candidatus Odinarchaeota archaeon]
RKNKQKKKKQDQKKGFLEIIKENIKFFRNYLLTIDPILEKHLDLFRECYSFLKKINQFGDEMSE